METVYVIAKNVHEFNYFREQTAVHVVYVSSIKTLIGVRSPIVLFLERARDRRDYIELSDYCTAIGAKEVSYADYTERYQQRHHQSGAP